jgi:NodT family efflux transporter outer membrane factor (OMF) lipoprotein
MHACRLDRPEKQKELLSRRLCYAPACLAGLLVLLSGCTHLREYFDNGFKVGPNYLRPPAPVAKNWIDAADPRVRQETDDLSQWWTVFNDPVLSALIHDAYRQNLTLHQAGCRVLQARAQQAISVGNIFPQTQQMTGDYKRYARSTKVPNNQNVRAPFYTEYTFGFNLAWELDFWGKFRRAIESANDNLDATVEDYDAVLVTLLGDVATYYVQLRTAEQRITYARANVELLRQTLRIAEARFKAGTSGELDVVQSRSTLEQTKAQIAELEISLRQANNQLCVLLGIPPEDLQARLGRSGIPTAPTEVAAGIPANLLRRRPDVRRTERQAAAQSAQIGVAEADFYPQISITGTINYAAGFPQLSPVGALVNLVGPPQGLDGNIGPTLTWNILNYGRIVNNVRLQDARFQELVAAYQQTVLNAAQDVENGLVTFLRAQERAKLQGASVEDLEKAVKIVLAQYKEGTVDLTRVTQIEQNLVLALDTLAQARGEIGLGLTQVYRALGGGWEIRCQEGPSAQAGVNDVAPGELPPAARPKQIPRPVAEQEKEKAVRNLIDNPEQLPPPLPQPQGER